MRKLGLAYKILIGMVLGAIIGFIVGPSIAVISPLGTVFLRLLRMTILPLIFFSVTSGVASIADLNRLKKVGGVFTGYWAISSILAASTGIFWALIIKPGLGINLPVTEKMDVNVDLLDSVIKWIPDNVPKAFADGNIIQVIVFAMFAGITAALLAKTEPGQRMIELFTAGDKLMSRMVGIVMNVAPYGVFALMANVTGTVGTIALKGIGKMLLTQYIAYATVLLIFYPIILKLMAGVNPINHYRNIFPAMVMAFSTQSSSATIPVTMDCTKRRAGVPDDIVNLICTLVPPRCPFTLFLRPRFITFRSPSLILLPSVC